MLAVLGGAAGAVVDGLAARGAARARARRPAAAAGDRASTARSLAFTAAIVAGDGDRVRHCCRRCSPRRTDVNDALKEGRAAPRRRAASLRSALVVVEFALALVLLVGAALLVRSFWRLQHVDLGFDPHNVLTARLWLPQPNDPPTGPYSNRTTGHRRASRLRGDPAPRPHAAGRDRRRRRRRACRSTAPRRRGVHRRRAARPTIVAGSRRRRCTMASAGLFRADGHPRCCAAARSPTQDDAQAQPVVDRHRGARAARLAGPGSDRPAAPLRRPAGEESLADRRRRRQRRPHAAPGRCRRCRRCIGRCGRRSKLLAGAGAQDRRAIRRRSRRRSPRRCAPSDPDQPTYGIRTMDEHCAERDGVAALLDAAARRLRGARAGARGGRHLRRDGVRGGAAHARDRHPHRARRASGRGRPARAAARRWCWPRPASPPARRRPRSRRACCRACCSRSARPIRSRIL